MVLPLIPLIRDVQLWDTVFTPKGRSPRPGGPDNGGLALLGASLIQACVTFIIYEMNPGREQSYLERKRAIYVEEKCLYDWATSYKLMERVRCDPTERAAIQMERKTHVELFEAYVAAVFTQDFKPGLNDGFSVLKNWIQQLINHVDDDGTTIITSPSVSRRSSIDTIVTGASNLNIHGTSSRSMNYASSSSSSVLPPYPASHPPATPAADRRMSSGPHSPQSPSSPPPAPVPPVTMPLGSPLSLLNEKAQQRRKVVEWTETPHGPDHTRQWTIAAFVDGRQVGSGFHHTKKGAKHLAAQEALQTLGW